MRLLVFAALTPLFVLADELPQWPAWLNYGVLGAVVLAIITKQLVPGWLYQDLKSEVADLKNDNQRLIDLMLEVQPKVTAALETGTKAVTDAMAELRILRRGDRP